MVLATVEIYPLHHPRVDSSASELKKKKWCSQTQVLSILWSKSQKWSVWKKKQILLVKIRLDKLSFANHLWLLRHTYQWWANQWPCALLRAKHVSCVWSHYIYLSMTWLFWITICFWLFPHCPVFILQIKCLFLRLCFLNLLLDKSIYRPSKD